MNVISLIILAAGSFVLMLFLLGQVIRLKRKLRRSKKELEIQEGKLDYQKEQTFDSKDYFCSAEIIIKDMMQEIDHVLKNEEGDLSEKIMQIIFEKANDLFRPEKCVLFRVAPENDRYTHLNYIGYDQEQLRKLSCSLHTNDSFVGWSASTGRFLSFDEVLQDSLLNHLIESDPLGCHYAQPLKVGDKVKAVLCVGRISQLIEKDIVLRLFSILSNVASVALSNAFLTQELRELSIRDSLTGLYNHSYFQKWLENAVARVEKDRSVLSLAMVDLDYFKQINDTYGHTTGDLILKGVSGLLNSLAAKDYICARYGGEEFILIFCGQGIDQTLPLMEDVRQRISQKSFTAAGQEIKIAVSVGMVEAKYVQDKKINKATLIESADQALYKAKAAGRNRVVVV